MIQTLWLPQMYGLGISCVCVCARVCGKRREHIHLCVFFLTSAFYLVPGSIEVGVIPDELSPIMHKQKTKSGLLGGNATPTPGCSEASGGCLWPLGALQCQPLSGSLWEFSRVTDFSLPWTCWWVLKEPLKVGSFWDLVRTWFAAAPVVVCAPSFISVWWVTLTSHWGPFWKWPCLILSFWFGCLTLRKPTLPRDDTVTDGTFGSPSP